MASTGRPETCIFVGRDCVDTAQPLLEHLRLHAFDIWGAPEAIPTEGCLPSVDVPIIVQLGQELASTGTLLPSRSLLLCLNGVTAEPRMLATASACIHADKLDKGALARVVGTLQRHIQELPHTLKSQTLATVRGALDDYQNERENAVSTLETILRVSLMGSKDLIRRGSASDATRVLLAAAAPVSRLLKSTAVFDQAGSQAEHFDTMLAKLSTFTGDLAQAGAHLQRAFETIQQHVYNYLAGVRTDGLDRASPRDIVDTIANTIEVGAPLYNAGRRGDCAALYLKAARSIRAAIAEDQSDTDYLRRTDDLLARALGRFTICGEAGPKAEDWAAKNQPHKLAWALRSAFDAILGMQEAPTQAVSIADEARRPMRPFESFDERNRMPPACDVFISYARDDKPALHRLLKHLRPLEREYKISFWHDEHIDSGERWRETILRNLWQAKLAILLLSPSFRSSDFINTTELPVLLKRAEDEGIRLLVLVLLPCAHRDTKTVFDDPEQGPRELTLKETQFVHSASQALSAMDETEQQTCFLRVAECVLESFRKDWKA